MAMAMAMADVWIEEPFLVCNSCGVKVSRVFIHDEQPDGDIRKICFNCTWKEMEEKGGIDSKKPMGGTM